VRQPEATWKANASGFGSDSGGKRTAQAIESHQVIRHCKQIWSVWFLWSIWLVWFNQTNETNQTNQITIFGYGLASFYREIFHELFGKERGLEHPTYAG
jgi:hypothetical protein